MIIDDDMGLGELFDYEHYVGGMGAYKKGRVPQWTEGPLKQKQPMRQRPQLPAGAQRPARMRRRAPISGMAQTVESYEGEGQYVQIDPYYYRSEGSWTYNQCIPFQVGYYQNRQTKKCPSGYVPSGQSACAAWVKQADGSYVINPFTSVSFDMYAYQQCVNQHLYECDGCRPVAGVAPSPYSQQYRVCEYQSSVKPPEEVQKEYLITQALRYGMIAGQNCRNLSICDSAGRPASYLRSCTFVVPQTGQQISFDAAAAYAAQFFNVPAQVIPVVQSAF